MTLDKQFYEPGLMDLSRYRLERAEPGPAWDAFVAASPQGTLFSETGFLDALQAKKGLWYCLRGEEAAAAICVTETADGSAAAGFPNVIYGGVLFAPPPPAQNFAQVLSERFRVLARVAETMPETYRSVTMTFHPSVNDMRPFSWHNYHGDGPRYVQDVRYTSLIDLADYAPETPLKERPGYAAANKSRRQELRYALDKGYTTAETFDPDLFIDLYRRTFERQDQSLDGTGIDELPAALCMLYDAGRLRMFVTSTAAGEPGTVGIFARDDKRWYYMYGAGNPDLREGHSGTLAMWDAFTALSGDGPQELDLEGVNSPRRGYFKLSFGGSLTPYFRVRIG